MIDASELLILIVQRKIEINQMKIMKQNWLY